MRLLLCVLVLAAAQIAPGQPASLEESLSRFEAALTEQPNNLRAGNDYRMAILKARQYDRAIAFFKSLTTSHPDAANAHLNYGFAYVDKIPSAGAISRVILANSSLTEFTRALELEPTWVGYYTRGASYLYWPKIFDRTRLGIADLEAALRRQRSDRKRPYHVRTFIALGDGYWIVGDESKARAAWRAGLEEFPDSAALKTRLAAGSAELKALIDDTYDPARPVDTNLEELWIE
jgi:tetratricopeptide (TPR) repeat protein